MNKKLVSTVMVLVLVLGAVCSCNKTGDLVTDETTTVAVDDETVQADASFDYSSYYDMFTFETEAEDTVSCWFGEQSILYSDEDCFILEEYYAVGRQDIIDEYNPVSEDNDVCRVAKYSISDENFGECIGSYDLKDFNVSTFSDFETEETCTMICDVFCEDSDVLVIVTKTQDYSDYSTTYNIIKVDINSGETISESYGLELDVTFNPNEWQTRGVENQNGIFYAVLTCWSEPKVKICKLDESLSTIDEIEINNFGNNMVNWVGDVRIISDDLVYISASDYNDISCAFIYRISTGEIEETPMVNSYEYYLMDEGGVYASDPYGVSKYDFVTGQKQVIVDFNNCNVNRNIANSELHVLIMTEDKLICSRMSTYGYTYVVFSGTDVNPFEGKEQLTVASLDNYITSQINDAIFLFNQNSDEYYITLDDRYLVAEYADVDMNNSYTSYIVSEEYRDSWRRAESYVSNQLMIDIIAGDGPDIILNGYSMTQFNSSNVMVDLNELIDNDASFNRDDFFNAIFSTTTDGLYQIPFDVSPLAISDSSDAESYRNDAFGITLSDYSSYVSEHCNGIDPLRAEFLGRTDYFLFLFNRSRDLFLADGQISVDSDEFRQLAEYCAQIPDISMNYDEYTSWLWESDTNAWFQEYGVEYTNGGIAIGIPSPDGSSVQLRCNQSVGITTCCISEDAAWEFVKILFSDDIQGQKYFGRVNRELYRIYTEESINEFNEQADNYFDPYDPTYVHPRYLDGAFDEMVSVMEAAESVYCSDRDIDIVLYEEIQAYFAGDKTIDEVIPLIEDRCQTIINERG